MTMMLPAAVVALAVALLIALLVLVSVSKRSNGHADLDTRLDELADHVGATSATQTRAYERLERELRGEITETARVSRSELNGGFSQFQQTLAAQFTSMTTLQSGKIDGFAQQLVKLTETNAQQLDAVRHSVQQQAQQAREEQAVGVEAFRRNANRATRATH